MSTIDIRVNEHKPPTKIIFADDNKAFDNVVSLDYLGEYYDGPAIQIATEYDATLRIAGCDVENLIKALQKAVELGWTK